GQTHVVLLVRDVDAAAAEALGYIRSFHPRSLRVITPHSSVPAALADRWTELAGVGAAPLEAAGPGSMTASVRRFIHSMDAGPHAVVNLVVPELIAAGGIPAYVLKRSDLVRLKASVLRTPHVVVTDVPVVTTHDGPRGVDAKPLIPHRTVALVFLSSVN